MVNTWEVAGSIFFRKNLHQSLGHIWLHVCNVHIILFGTSVTSAPLHIQCILAACFGMRSTSYKALFDVCEYMYKISRRKVHMLNSLCASSSLYMLPTMLMYEYIGACVYSLAIGRSNIIFLDIYFIRHQQTSSGSPHKMYYIPLVIL